MIFVKTKGTDKVPDYVQIRDDNFALIEIIKISYIDKKIKELFPEKAQKIIEKIKSAEIGKIIKV